MSDAASSAAAAAAGGAAAAAASMTLTIIAQVHDVRDDVEDVYLSCYNKDAEQSAPATKLSCFDGE
jgi:hypothetical protein